MRVLILGATGKTGRHLVRLANERGMTVTAFGRKTECFAGGPATVSIVQGSVAEYDTVLRAVEGHDAVISALGVARPLSSDQAVIDGIGNTLEAMHVTGVNRLIYLSFIGVSDSRPDAGPFIKHVAKRVLRHEIADHEIKEAMIQESPTEWTIVRPPRLTNGPATGKYRKGEDIVSRSFFPSLPREDVADFMLQQLSDPTYVRRSPRILP